MMKRLEKLRTDDKFFLAKILNVFHNTSHNFIYILHILEFLLLL